MKAYPRTLIVHVRTIWLSLVVIASSVPVAGFAQAVQPTLGATVRIRTAEQSQPEWITATLVSIGTSSIELETGEGRMTIDRAVILGAEQRVVTGSWKQHGQFVGLVLGIAGGLAMSFHMVGGADIPYAFLLWPPAGAWAGYELGEAVGGLKKTEGWRPIERWPHAVLPGNPPLRPAP